MTLINQAIPNPKNTKLGNNKYHNSSDNAISDQLHLEINSALANKQQTLLFLNRKGYAPIILCHNCQFIFSCINCSSFLVEYKNYHNKNTLICHHCGYIVNKPKTCPKCSNETLKSIGRGVEKIAEEVRDRYPKANIQILTSDYIRSNKNIDKVLSDIKTGRIDIIVATEVLAKGHHFPKLSLVGILDADFGLSHIDLKANERSYQLLTQVAGRAGREELKGKVYIQTFFPKHIVMQHLIAQNFQGLIEYELTLRETMQMPPFYKMAAIIVTSNSEEKANYTANFIANHNSALSNIKEYIKCKQVEILGPAPCMLYYLKRKYNIRILVKTSNKINIQKVISILLTDIKSSKLVQIKIDMNPCNFY